MKRILLPLVAIAMGGAAPIVNAGPERLVIGAEAGKGIAIVDPAANNKVLWHHPVGAVHDLHLLPGPRFLTQDGWPKVIEIGLDHKIVWQYDAATQNREDGKKVEVHSYQRLGDGRTLISESGSSRLIEVDASGEIVREFPWQVSQSRTHSDTRLVRRLENGHTLAAHEGDEMVKEYDADGKVVWEFKIPLFGRQPAGGHGPEAFGGHCFSAIKAKNGNYLITSGNGHSVLEVTPAKEVVWKLEQNDLPGITLAWATTLYELPNGHLMIGNCHAGPDNPQIVEITRDKRVVWTFKDFSTFGNSLANTIVLDGEEAKALRAALLAKGE
ncbi:MAG: PQQ-binding-like beta-propeller repeat protein [Verrucomicrobiae bacterium]|nr:PQQ-binding-like beta-propeller repeat protein [Verrucomicrobiae bacterium]MCP5540903.1 PQQ-binding-like beta-propeller repeat protein [Akkermansiaceae bacterium]